MIGKCFCLQFVLTSYNVIQSLSIKFYHMNALDKQYIDSAHAHSINIKWIHKNICICLRRTVKIWHFAVCTSTCNVHNTRAGDEVNCQFVISYWEWHMRRSSSMYCKSKKLETFGNEVIGNLLRSPVFRMKIVIFSKKRKTLFIGTWIY